MSDGARPAPYPADTRAKGWRFELDYERIDQSDTWGLAGAMAFDGLPLARALLLAMWYAAWKQTPCGSLPADDKLIAAAVGIPSSVFAEYREVLMRGWWLADDGRLYHDVLTERVNGMLDRRSSNAHRRHFTLIFEKCNGSCVYCGSHLDLTIDHIIPRSRGGADTAENLVIACRSCNSSKGARTPDEWRLRGQTP